MTTQNRFLGSGEPLNTNSNQLNSPIFRLVQNAPARGILTVMTAFVSLAQIASATPVTDPKSTPDSNDVSWTQELNERGIFRPKLRINVPSVNPTRDEQLDGIESTSQNNDLSTVRPGTPFPTNASQSAWTQESQSTLKIISKIFHEGLPQSSLFPGWKKASLKFKKAMKEQITLDFQIPFKGMAFEIITTPEDMADWAFETLEYGKNTFKVPYAFLNRAQEVIELELARSYEDPQPLGTQAINLSTALVKAGGYTLIAPIAGTTNLALALTWIPGNASWKITKVMLLGGATVGQNTLHPVYRTSELMASMTSTVCAAVSIGAVNACLSLTASSERTQVRVTQLQ